MKSIWRARKNALHNYCKQEGNTASHREGLAVFLVVLNYFGCFLLHFYEKWVSIIIQVEESGVKWYEVVDKFITLWTTTESR